MAVVRSEHWFQELMGKRSEDSLIATADCPECLSKDTIFHMFDGERADDEKGMMKYITIRGEVHVCRSCLHKFTKTDGPWIGLTVGDWAQAMKYGLVFDRLQHYTDWVRRTFKS